MARYWRILTCADMVQTVQAWEQVLVAAERYNAASRGRGAATLELLDKAYVDYTRQMDQLAARTAARADEYIKQMIAATAKRPDHGGGKKHMRDHIRSEPRPGPLGFADSVGVARISELDKIRNPYSVSQRGREPYWLAQERGSTHNVGRVIRGYFFGPGFSNPERPVAGASDASMFLSGTAAQAFGLSPRGGRGGLGTIQRPITPRHFLDRGADRARADWFRGIRVAEQRSIAEIRAVTRAAPTRRAARGPRVAPRRRLR